MARTWSAVLARLGVPTGDGRLLAEGGGSSRDLPLPLLYQRETGDGHGGSVVIGRIETLSIGNDMITATGSLLDTAEYSAVDSIEAGVIGPSVDLDDIEYVADEEGNATITRWRVAGATLVAIPAFADVSLTLDPLPVEPMPTGPSYELVYSLMASVRTTGWADMPIADEARPWDGAAAAGRVFAWATNGDTTDWARYARAFLRKDDDANPETRGAYGFGIADVIDGTLTIVPRGVFAAAAATQGARGNGTPQDAEAMQRVLRGIYGRMDRDAPFALAASASVAEVLPPAEWFAAPDVDRVTPLTVTDTGRVFGHIAPWGQCHVGMPGCVTAPTSPTGYSYFHVGTQRVQDGAVLPVGTLTVGGGHADASLGFMAAAEHYDNVGAAVAKVVAGEDEFGIWVSGWLLPSADPTRREQFMSSPVSGDWRSIGGSLEMIAVCSVNTPGFPVPRARVSFALGVQRSLIGTFGIKPVEGALPDQAQESEDMMMAARAKWAWINAKGK